jgi:hypothetical protein
MDKFSLWMQTVVRLELQHFSRQTAIISSNHQGDVMDCQAIEESRSPAREALFTILIRRLARGIGSRMPQLDMDVTPDRIKRDLGFLDGRDPRYEDDRLR